MCKYINIAVIVGLLIASGLLLVQNLEYKREKFHAISQATIETELRLRAFFDLYDVYTRNVGKPPKSRAEFEAYCGPDVIDHNSDLCDDVNWGVRVRDEKVPEQVLLRTRCGNMIVEMDTRGHQSWNRADK
jgi:hypothetical protein